MKHYICFSFFRKHHGKLRDEVFGQKPETNKAVVTGHFLRPTSGYQIAITEESKALGHSLNTKRIAIVSGSELEKSQNFVGN